MVELSEKLVLPSLGALTGFESASSGLGGLNSPLHSTATLLASFVVGAYCVKLAAHIAGWLAGFRGHERGHPRMRSRAQFDFFAIFYYQPDASQA
jgi:hypothetical protein